MAKPRQQSEARAEVRLDKWLWAARFYKGRDLAARACELGRVESNGQRAKPARPVRAGDELRIRTEGGDFEVEVLALSDMRGPAAVAQTLYRETDASRERRKRELDARRALGGLDAAALGPRPDSRDRQARERMRGKG